MLNLARGFAHQGQKVDLILTNAEGQYLDEVPDTIKIVDFQNIRFSSSFKFSTGFQSVRSIPKLVQYLKKHQPKILLSATHFTNEGAIVAKHLARVPTQVIVTEHVHLSIEAKQVEQMSSRLAPFAARMLYPFADAIVAVSQGAAQSLSELTGIDRQKIQVIYNPVILPDLQAKASEQITHPWFAPGEPPVLLGIGRFVAQKDFPTLIRAFAKVKQVQPARLMMLGSGREEENLKTLAKELKIEEDIAWMGFVSNPFAYMKQAALFVLSSAWEGLPTVLIEALALGIPVVSTNCPSGPAEILAHGQYGELVPVGDTDAMAQAILRVLSGEVKSVHSDWLEQFTWENSTQQYLKIFGISNE